MTTASSEKGKKLRCRQPSQTRERVQQMIVLPGADILRPPSSALCLKIPTNLGGDSARSMMVIMCSPTRRLPRAAMRAYR
jgi:hypothetical protein